MEDFGFEGLKYYSAAFSRLEQEDLLVSLRKLVALSPLFQPVMPGSGTAFSVKMTNFGSLGWVADARGYRYQQTHPVTGEAWPAIPQPLLELWNRVADTEAAPDVCLLNYYNSTARMGLHQDKDEADLNAPVVSLSLGDSALYRLGGLTRGGKTTSFKLHSGDALVLGGASRLRFHGIDKIYAGSSNLLRMGGRMSLTLRKARGDAKS